VCIGSGPLLEIDEPVVSPVPDPIVLGDRLFPLRDHVVELGVDVIGLVDG
jgi:hypothetical protein